MRFKIGIVALSAVVTVGSAACGGSSQGDEADQAAATTALSDGVPAPETTEEAPAAPTEIYVPTPLDDPASATDLGFIELGTSDDIDYVDTMVATADGVWVNILGDRDSEAANRAVLLAPDGSVLQDVELGDRPGSIAASRGAVWVSGFLEGITTRIGPDGTSIEIAGVDQIAASGDIVWATKDDPDTGRFEIVRLAEIDGAATGDVLHVDPADRPEIVGEVDDGFRAFLEESDGGPVPEWATLATDGTDVWHAGAFGLSRADATTGRVDLVAGVLGEDAEARSMLAVDGGVWLAGTNRVDGDRVEQLWFVSSAGELVATIDIPRGGSRGQLVTDGALVYLDGVDDPSDGPGVTVVHGWDMATYELVVTHELDSSHELGLAVAHGQIWVASNSPYGIHRLG